MASVVEQVKAAKTPREAILILAAAIDELRTAQPTDPWQDWGDGGVFSSQDPAAALLAAGGDAPLRGDESAVPTGDVDREGTDAARAADSSPLREITDDEARAWVGKNYGRVPDDDVEGRALLAWVKRELQNSTGATVADDLFSMSAAGVVESEIDFAPLDEAHRAEREKFAREVLQLDVALGEPPPGQEPYDVLYGKGGPMWFYIPNRELLMDYPDHVKQTMIEDLERYDHKVAYEFAYDVLKAPMLKDQNSPAMRVATPGD